MNLDHNKVGTIELKNIKEGSKLFELHQQLKATLGSGDLRSSFTNNYGVDDQKSAVKCPPDEDPNEWLAVNIIDFFNQINVIYGSIASYCTSQTCPIMSAGPKYEYLWADGKKIKKPIQVSAEEYANYLMTWVQEQFQDETIFPVADDTPFPNNFRDICSQIFKRLFRIYAHTFYSHTQQIIDLGVEAHLNSAFKHFYLFIKEFTLVSKQDMAPLQHLIDKIEKQLEEQDKN